MIKMIPHFATTDGRVHASLDDAVAHERRSLTVAMLLSGRDRLGIELTEIDAAADIICATADDIVKVFTADLKRGLHHVGMVDRPCTSHFGQRLAETIHTDKTKKAIDADGKVLYLGDTVTLVPSDPESLRKWGDQRERQIGDIQPNGAVAFKGDSSWVWPGELLRKKAA